MAIDTTECRFLQIRIFWHGWMKRLIALVLLALLMSCGGSGSGSTASFSVISSGITLNPEGATPLAAEVEIETDIPTSLELSVDDGVDSWEVIFPGHSTRHSVPVLGLKPNASYLIVATIKQQFHKAINSEVSFSIVTDPLPENFPRIEVHEAMPEYMEPGYFLLDRIGLYTIILDNYGDVVWYANVGGQGMAQLTDGSLFYRTLEKFTAIDMLGRTVRSINHGSNLFHHEAFLTVDGTILTLGHEPYTVEGYPTSQTDPEAPLQTAVIQADPVFEIDENGGIIGKWEPMEILDPTRIGYGSLNSAPLGFDWGHSNAVFHDIRDDLLIVSIRHQDAVIKFSRKNGELIWILANHDNWPSHLQSYLFNTGWLTICMAISSTCANGYFCRHHHVA